MQTKIDWIRILYWVGVTALIIGAIDPLEGSVVVGAGSAMLVLSSYLSHDRYWKLFLELFFLIIIGIFFLFYFSTLGGFGGNSSLSWWWGALILPYPIGWLLTIILLIVRYWKLKTNR
jgi:hypothetical protein